MPPNFLIGPDEDYRLLRVHLNTLVPDTVLPRRTERVHSPDWRKGDNKSTSTYELPDENRP